MVVKVSAGAILREGSVFIALRGVGQHQGGLWEFPGGKCEFGESAELALSRELKEEIGIEVCSSFLLMELEHDYGDKTVCLSFFVVDDFKGEPKGVEGQLVKWVPLRELQGISFPKANVAFVDKLLDYYSTV